jgi:hypothetical protein
MIVSGLLLLVASAFLSAIGSGNGFYFNGATHAFNATYPFQSGTFPTFASGIIGVLGGFGLISGIIVLISGVMLRGNPSQRTTWGVLILVFSVLSFFGFGGFIIGAILGSIGGILALTWKPSPAPA